MSCVMAILHIVLKPIFSKFFSNGLQGLIGLLVKLASGSIVAVRTLFELNISRILKDILSTPDLSHGSVSPNMVDGHCNQVFSYIKQHHLFLRQFHKVCCYFPFIMLVGINHLEGCGLKL